MGDGLAAAQVAQAKGVVAVYQQARVVQTIRHCPSIYIRFWDFAQAADPTSPA